VDPGETLLEGAKRELTEETGYSARKWPKALYYYASPGFMNETMTIFMARELKKGVATPEEDEVIRSKFFPLSTATKMVMSGKIIDGKTIAGILWLDRVTNRS
jgi:ADP-ribose pyrophosphatase